MPTKEKKWGGRADPTGKLVECVELEEHPAIEAMDWLEDNANSISIALVFDGKPHKLFWLTGHASFCDGVLAYKKQMAKEEQDVSTL